MAGAGRGTFVERQQAGQFLSSKLVGTTVYGSNNERVGDVNDVLMDRDGKAQALVIGVGGFLGIGEKDVAVPFNAVEFSSGNSGTAGGASGSTSGTGTSGGTASTAGSTGGATSSSATARNDGAPDRIVLRMTKDQLNAAPQFTRLSSTSSSSTTGAGTNTGSGARTNAPGSSTSGGTGANPSTGTGAGTTR